MQIKKTSITIGVLVLIGLLGFWVIGWETVNYDKNDAEVGSKIMFTAQMLKITNIPDKFAGKYIKNKYGAVLQSEKSWRNFEHAFPDVSTEKIDCDEIFQVVDALYIIRHGLLLSAFTNSSLKYYVLTSEKHKKTVIWRGEYDSYAKNIKNISDDSMCNSVAN